MKRYLIAGFVIIHFTALAQESKDSTRVLQEVEVKGYLYDRSLSEAPASIAILSQLELERFNNTTLLPAFNSVPGVKMEERSPGSYRLSIRGSSIRSPFGVRNVKIYRNGLPITDAGGNTYLNVFDFSGISSIEVIKGPGGSLYGAGTGGVVLLNSKPRSSTGAEISSVIGSYGLRRYQLRGDLATEKVHATIQYAHQQSEGYREQTATDRDAFDGEVLFSLGQSTTLTATLFYTDLFYETPGGLTLQQFDDDPRQARPAGGPTAGAVDQNASVVNKMGYAGILAEHDWSEKWSTRLGAFASNTDFRNFAIANYEARDESNSGFRLENSYTFNKRSWKGKLSFGAEYQNSASPIDVSENNGGVIGQLLIEDDLNSRQGLAFAQMEMDLPKGFYLTAGFSENWVSYDFFRKYPEVQKEEKNFSPQFSPRIALLKKLDKLSLYGSVSRGFSPPTLAEVRPSTNVFNGDLEPETGTNVEVGARHAGNKLSWDVTLYNFSLDETIVLQRVENGAEYFVNAGATLQRGAEFTASWNANAVLRFWTSMAYHYYRFKDYVKYDDYVRDEVDYSGNQLTGVAPLTGTLGLDLNISSGIYSNVVYSYTDRIPLNDLNDEFAKDYFLLNVRAGYRKTFSDKYFIDVFVAADNLFDEKYSLGNDLNARARRFYNAAPDRNYSLGIKFQIL